jgi:hypothetical protein
MLRLECVPGSSVRMGAMETFTAIKGSGNNEGLLGAAPLLSYQHRAEHSQR